VFERVPPELVYSFYTACIVGFGVLAAIGKRFLNKLETHGDKLVTIDNAVNNVGPGTPPLTKRLDKLSTKFDNYEKDNERNHRENQDAILAVGERVNDCRADIQSIKHTLDSLVSSQLTVMKSQVER
jgi:hypothetical protein